MPKMKTHRAGAKRYKITANGKFLRRQAGKKHLLTHKSSEKRRNLSGMVEIFDGNIEKVKLELPYTKYSR